MATDRFTIVGLARARTTWFSEVARWSASSLVPADFTKCVSAAEVRVRLDTLGAVSAVLLDAGAPGVDRDLIADARDAGAAALVVEDGRSPRDWSALGASAVLPLSFDADLLVARLRATAAPTIDRTAPSRRPAAEPASFVAPLIAVCGVPGAGASTVAMAVAEGLASRADGHGSVVLADFAHDGMLGTYHGAPDVVPGLQEVVEAHRGGRPDRIVVRAVMFEVESRGYSLLLGLRRPRDWTALPTRAADATLVSLRSSFRWVVADLTADLDGEPETGSIDVEERNHLARSSVMGAACVLAVGTPGIRGVRGLVRLLDALSDLGIDGGRIVPVINQAPRSALARAEITRAVASLTVDGGSEASALHLSPRRGLELTHRTVDRLPSQLVAPVLAATIATLAWVGREGGRNRTGSRADPPGGVVTVDDSPVSIIEHAVQDRARVDAIGVDEPDGERAIRRMIAEEVQRWQDDHRRGHRPHLLVDPDAVADRAFRNLARYGPLTSLLADDDVWEVMVNAPDQIFVKRHRGPSGYHDEVFVDDDHVIRTLTRLLDRSSTSHRKLDPAEGLQDAQLDDGARLHIVHGDLSRGGHVMVNIRKFTGVTLTELDQLVERRMLSTHAAEFLSACVRARLSIVFAGPPGSGKTTLLSCCAAELDPSLRVVIAEEVFEADVPLANVASMQTRAPRPDRPGIDLRRLVSGFLRMAPDVAIVGEVRDREALPLLLTLSSGVTGYTTIHAGSARQALTRLRFVAQLSDVSADLPISALNTLVSEAVDVVVHTERTTDGPMVTEIIAVEDLAGGIDAAQFTATDVFGRERGGELTWSGHLPIRARTSLERVGVDLAELLAGRR